MHNSYNKYTQKKYNRIKEKYNKSNDKNNNTDKLYSITRLKIILLSIKKN